MPSSDIANAQTLPNFDQLWNYGDPAATETRFREILPAAEASGDTEYMAQLMTQVARCQGLQGDFKGSHSTLDQVEKLLSSNDLRLAKVRYYLERGRAFNSGGDPKRSIPLFLSAYEIAEIINEPRYAIDAVHMVAIAEQNPANQIKWNLKGIAMAEADAKQSGWLFALLNNIGESYLKLPNYTSAESSFRRLADLQRERRGEADMYTLKDLAKAIRLAGRPEEAAGLMALIMERLLSESKDDGYIRQELAEALHATGRTAYAKPHFARAAELLSQDPWAAENDAAGIARARELAK